jgi:MoxR-like ATPase
LSFDALADGVDTVEIAEQLLTAVPPPRVVRKSDQARQLPGT